MASPYSPTARELEDTLLSLTEDRIQEIKASYLERHREISNIIRNAERIQMIQSVDIADLELNTLLVDNEDEDFLDSEEDIIRCHGEDPELEVELPNNHQMVVAFDGTEETRTQSGGLQTLWDIMTPAANTFHFFSATSPKAAVRKIDESTEKTRPRAATTSGATTSSRAKPRASVERMKSGAPRTNTLGVADVSDVDGKKKVVSVSPSISSSSEMSKYQTSTTAGGAHDTRSNESPIALPIPTADKIIRPISQSLSKRGMLSTNQTTSEDTVEPIVCERTVAVAGTIRGSHASPISSTTSARVSINDGGNDVGSMMHSTSSTSAGPPLTLTRKGSSFFESRKKDITLDPVLLYYEARLVDLTQKLTLAHKEIDELRGKVSHLETELCRYKDERGPGCASDASSNIITADVCRQDQHQRGLRGSATEQDLDTAGLTIHEGVIAARAVVAEESSRIDDADTESAGVSGSSGDCINKSTLSDVVTETTGLSADATPTSAGIVKLTSNLASAGQSVEQLRYERGELASSTNQGNNDSVADDCLVKGLEEVSLILKERLSEISRSY